MCAQQTFFQQLRQIWSQSPAASILNARLRPMEIPEETLRYAMQMQQSFALQQQVDRSVDAQLGAMGIFGGGGSGGGFGFGFGGGNPDEMIFLASMGLVRAHGGDPPATPALRTHAAAILRGHVDPMEAFALGSTVPGAGALIQNMAGLIGDMGPFLRLQAIIMAALAVPRDQIPALLGLPEEVELTLDDEDLELLEQMEREARDEEAFEQALSAGQQALAGQDFGRAEDELATALEAAGRTSTVDDDIQAIDHMMLLGFKSSITPDSLSLCLQALDRLAGGEDRLDDLARIAVSLSVLGQGFGLEADLNRDLARIGSSLLDRNLSASQRLSLALMTARVLHRTGNTGEAEDLIADLEPLYPQADARAEIASLKADLWWDSGDRDGAADLLLETLDAAEDVDAPKRFDLVQKLICVWPDDRGGIEPWLEELERVARGLEEPLRTMSLVTGTLAVSRAGKADEARRMAARVDLSAVEGRIPPALLDMFEQIRDGLDHLA